MYKTNIFLLILLLSGATTNAQQNIPGKKVVAPLNVAGNITKVLSVVLSIDSTTHIPNSTTYHNYFKATVGSIGIGTVNFKWIITSIGPQAPPLIIPCSITLSGTGTDYIYLQKSTFRGPISFKLRLQAETPNQVQSNFIEYN